MKVIFLKIKKGEFMDKNIEDVVSFLNKELTREKRNKLDISNRIEYLEDMLLKICPHENV